MVELLCQYGADVKALNSDNKTALDLAKDNNHRDVERILTQFN